MRIQKHERVKSLIETEQLHNLRIVKFTHLGQGKAVPFVGKHVARDDACSVADTSLHTTTTTHTPTVKLTMDLSAETHLEVQCILSRSTAAAADLRVRNVNCEWHQLNKMRWCNRSVLHCVVVYTFFKNLFQEDLKKLSIAWLSGINITIAGIPSA